MAEVKFFRAADLISLVNLINLNIYLRTQDQVASTEGLAPSPYSILGKGNNLLNDEGSIHEIQWSELGLSWAVISQISISYRQFIGFSGQDLLTLLLQASDQLVGSPFSDVLAGRGGADIIKGMDGDDRLLGGAGNDKLYGDAGSDVIQGSLGSDELTGGTGFNTLQAGQGADLLTNYGGSGDSYGGAGANRFKGYDDGFADTLYILVEGLGALKADVIEDLGLEDRLVFLGAGMEGIEVTRYGQDFAIFVGSSLEAIVEDQSWSQGALSSIIGSLPL